MALFSQNFASTKHGAIQGFLLGLRQDGQSLALCDWHALLRRSQLLVQRFPADSELTGEGGFLFAGSGPLPQPGNFLI